MRVWTGAGGIFVERIVRIAVATSVFLLAPWPIDRVSADEVTLQITDDLDDFKETARGRAVTKSATYKLWSRGDARVAYRFPNLPVPPNATITSARLEVYAAGKSTVDRALDGFILGQAVSDAPLVNDSHFQIRDATKTSANISVNGLPPWTPDAYNTLADVTPILQEIVDRPDWAAGNDVRLFLTAAYTTTAARRVGTARKQRGARLIVSWHVDVPVDDGVPYYVRPVYFLAADDETFEPEWEAKLQTAFILTQRFYAEELQRNGYGYRPFNLELDGDGKPRIFFVRGQRESTYYAEAPQPRIQQELEGIFSREKTVVAVTSEFGPYQGGGGGTPRGGYAFVGDFLASDFATTVEGQLQLFCDQSIPTDSPPGWEGSTRAHLSSVRFGGLMHELGHAFGVQHSANQFDIVSLGYLGAANYFMPGCVWSAAPVVVPGTALVLNNSAFFRSTTLYTDNTRPTLSYTFPYRIAAGESLPIEFTIGDAHGTPAVLVINFGGASHQFDVSGLGNPATFTHVFRFWPLLEPQSYRIGFELFDDSANRLIDDGNMGTPAARDFDVVPPFVPTLDPGEIVWMEDDYPTGAQPFGAWNLQTLVKASGSHGHRHLTGFGFREVGFDNAATGAELIVDADDALSTWVYVVPGASLEMIGLQWRVGTEWRRAYWGADRIPSEWGGHRQRIGDLPPMGRWVRLFVPAAAVELGGQTLNGFSFMVYGPGNVYMDRVGKVPPVPTVGLSEQVWAEDGFPAGASVGGPWDWQSAVALSGTRSHEHISTGGQVDAYFYDVATPLVLAPDAVLRTWIHVVPGSQFDTIDLLWRVGGTWIGIHWGAGIVAYADGGEMPPAGSWIPLDVRVGDLNIQGFPINGFRIVTSGAGTLYVDRVGVLP